MESDLSRQEFSDDARYQLIQSAKHKEWEAKCTRCGACCGIIEGDPCEHLVESWGGKYTCSIYENRFGLHQTKSGKPFCCVPIRDILHQPWPGDHCCGYKK
jgi:hypothetical protein